MKKEICIHFEMYCPNCAEHLLAYRNKDGKVKIECPICGVKYITQKIGRRHEQIDMFAPDGQVSLH